MQTKRNRNGFRRLCAAAVLCALLLGFAPAPMAKAAYTLSGGQIWFYNENGAYQNRPGYVIDTNVDECECTYAGWYGINANVGRLTFADVAPGEDINIVIANGCTLANLEVAASFAGEVNIYGNSTNPSSAGTLGNVTAPIVSNVHVYHVNYDPANIQPTPTPEAEYLVRLYYRDYCGRKIYVPTVFREGNTISAEDVWESIGSAERYRLLGIGTETLNLPNFDGLYYLSAYEYTTESGEKSDVHWVLNPQGDYRYSKKNQLYDLSYVFPTAEDRLTYQTQWCGTLTTDFYRQFLKQFHDYPAFSVKVGWTYGYSYDDVPFVNTADWDDFLRETEGFLRHGGIYTELVSLKTCHQMLTLMTSFVTFPKAITEEVRLFCLCGR